jgi:hypothetical protein
VNGNTIHFDWDRAPFGGNYVLKVITHNIKTNQNFLYKQVDADTEMGCWELMLLYVEKSSKMDSNFTVSWKTADGKEHLSYFRAKDEDEVRNKFYHDNDGEILGIKLNPIS